MTVQIVKEVDVFLQEKYWLKINGEYKRVYDTLEEAEKAAKVVIANIENGYPKAETVSEWHITTDAKSNEITFSDLENICKL
jgi:hypothetical protein